MCPLGSHPRLLQYAAPERMVSVCRPAGKQKDLASRGAHPVDPIPSPADSVLQVHAPPSSLSRCR